MPRSLLNSIKQTIQLSKNNLHGHPVDPSFVSKLFERHALDGKVVDGATLPFLDSSHNL